MARFKGIIDVTFVAETESLYSKNQGLGKTITMHGLKKFTLYFNGQVFPVKLGDDTLIYFTQHATPDEVKD